MYFNTQLLVNFIFRESLPPFDFVLYPGFFFSSLWVPPLHWSSSESCLANRTGFSDYNSVISITGKTCTGRTAFGGDFPALGTLLFEASPHRFKLTFFFSQLFEIQLPVIWLCPDFNSSLHHLSQVPITSSQPTHAFLLLRIWWSKSVTQITSSTLWKIKVSDGKTWNLKYSVFNLRRLSPCIRTAKVPVTTVVCLTGTVLICTWNAFPFTAFASVGWPLVYNM